jgi:hypothetical protein
MNNNDQQIIDFLYTQIITQKIRCDHFKLIIQAPQSIWNKYRDEKTILDKITTLYKKFYINKLNKLKIILEEKKIYYVTSYLTYNTDFYLNQHKKMNEDIEKYLTNISNTPTDNITTTNIFTLSTDINTLVPNYLPTPTLFNYTF